MDKKEIKIHVTEKEYDKIKEKALLKGMSIRAYAKMAVLQRRDRKPTTDTLLYLDGVYDALKEVTEVLSLVDRKLERLFGMSEEDSLYVDALIEAELDFRRLAREVTTLTKTISGEINDGNS